MKSEDRKMKEIEMTKMVEEMDLRNLTPEVDMTDLVIATPDINRPALQLTGYYEHFANERVQIIGYVEFTYLQHLEESERVRAFEEFVSRKIPCAHFHHEDDSGTGNSGAVQSLSGTGLCGRQIDFRFHG